MANKAKSGRHIVLFNPVVDYENPVDSGDLQPNEWVMVKSRADANSVIPAVQDGTVLRTKHAGTTTLAAGDEVYPVNLGKPVAITECTIPFNQDTIDVTDNESGAFASYITTGFTDLSGTITKFTKFTPAGTIDDYSIRMINRFADYVEDEGDFQQKFTPSDNEEFLAFICWNSDAQKNEKQYWLIFNMIVTSFDPGGALRDALKGDMNYNKGSGSLTFYARKVGDNDKIKIG